MLTLFCTAQPAFDATSQFFALPSASWANVGAFTAGGIAGGIIMPLLPRIGAKEDDRIIGQMVMAGGAILYQTLHLAIHYLNKSPLYVPAIFTALGFATGYGKQSKNTFASLKKGGMYATACLMPYIGGFAGIGIKNGLVALNNMRAS